MAFTTEMELKRRLPSIGPGPAGQAARLYISRRGDTAARALAQADCTELQLMAHIIAAFFMPGAPGPGELKRLEEALRRAAGHGRLALAWWRIWQQKPPQPPEHGAGAEADSWCNAVVAGACTDPPTAEERLCLRLPSLAPGTALQVARVYASRRGERAAAALLEEDDCCNTAATHARGELRLMERILDGLIAPASGQRHGLDVAGALSAAASSNALDDAWLQMCCYCRAPQRGFPLSSVDAGVLMSVLEAAASKGRWRSRSSVSS